MLRLAFLSVTCCLIVCVGCISYFVIADIHVVHQLNKRFDNTKNHTNLPDYRVNGLLIHTNDGWADIEILERSRQLGFVSMSYIRRDVSRNHSRPIFFDPDFRSIPWMRDDLVGTGIILDSGAAFTPLCFFITDAASVNRHHFGCGGYLEVEDQDFDWPLHFKRYGFESIPEQLSHAPVAQPEFESIYEPDRGISTCQFYNIRDSFDYDAKLLTDWRTTCAFAIDRESFEVALSFSRKYIRDYNEFLVREWSGLDNPVSATFYVFSENRNIISRQDISSFRRQALAIRDRYFSRTGRALPVYRMNLDAFQSDADPLLNYKFADNNPLSLISASQE